MAKTRGGFYRHPTLFGRVLDLHWVMIFTLTAIAAIGVAMLYSVSQGEIDGMARVQAQRFGLGLGAMIVVALVPIRYWAQMAYPFYVVVLALLEHISL